MKCIICNQEPQYPEVDLSTGFTFCADCMHYTKELYRRRIARHVKHAVDYDHVSVWLSAIAACRQETSRRQHVQGQPV
jgi:hypothetical protein